MPKINCAIYTRKSTEHGLEMEFNSLQNQEEACKAYILSQAFNGWEYYKTFEDGGISGGTMERPGLQALLEEIRERNVGKHTHRPIKGTTRVRLNGWYRHSKN